MGRQHLSSSVIVDAQHVERICAFEAEHDSILIVHAHGVPPSQITADYSGSEIMSLLKTLGPGNEPHAQLQLDVGEPGFLHGDACGDADKTAECRERQYRMHEKPLTIIDGRCEVLA